MRRNQKRGMSYVTAGLITVLLISAATYLAFTKEIPFQEKFRIEAVVPSANSLKKGSFVRIAGVNVGKVTKVAPVEPGESGQGAARVTMELQDKARPIHKDATLKIRPRIFFEGNFFVDLTPGSPEAPEMGNGETIPINQADTPVQFDQILTSLQSDSRQDLKTLLSELGTSLRGGGAEAINRTIPHWEPAYKNTAIVAEASLGQFEHDLSGYIRGAGRVAEALDRNEQQLKSLITDLATTFSAFAARDEELERGIEELPRTLRAGQPALAELNASLPSVSRFAADLRPGVRSTGPAIDAQIPFVRQTRRLMGRNELRGLSRDLRALTPDLARASRTIIPVLQNFRAIASCLNNVIIPWSNDKIEDPDFPADGPVYQAFPKSLVGLAGESRSFDANGQWFRVSPSVPQVATAFGDNRFLLTERAPVGANPPKPTARPPLRNDVECETQEPPDLRTKQAAPPPSFKIREPSSGAALERATKAREIAVKWLERQRKMEGKDDLKVVDELASRADLLKLAGGGGR